MGSLNEMSSKCINNWNQNIIKNNKTIRFSYPGVRNITSRRYLTPLLVGILVGFLVATVFISADSKSILFGFSTKSPHVDLRDPHSSVDLTDAEGPEKDVGFHASHEGAHAHENKSIAEKLYKDVRILCWIMTTPKNHQKKARHVKRTWGNRCNRLLFMSTAEGINFCLKKKKIKILFILAFHT